MNALNKIDTEKLLNLLKDLNECLFGFENEKPLDVNVSTTFGDTPLHVASIRGDVTAIDLLLKAGADIEALGEGGYPPLYEAIEHGNYEAVKFLLSKGASTDKKTDENNNAYTLVTDDNEMDVLLHRASKRKK